MSPEPSPPLSRGVLFEIGNGQAAAATQITRDVLSRAMLSRVGSTLSRKKW